MAAAAGAPQPGTDLYVNERIARWNGWSLSAPRPGLPLNRSADPAVAADPDPQADEPVTPFKMTTQFAAHPGSLPQLRFGDRYRLRVRAVDLAGQSVPPGAPAGDAFTAPANGATLPHLRYEPVNPPVVVERTLPGPGGSHAQLVVRSFNNDPSLDSVPSAETDERHIAPPRAAVQLVEQHGMLDDGNGRLRGDATTYAEIVSRDAGQFATVGDTPLEPGEQLTVPYFPDPLAHGAALAGLPHTPDGTESVINGGTLSYQAPPDVVPLAGSITQISYGTGWPDRLPFRIRLAEATGAPSWDDGQRVLTVSLAKAEVATVPLSSYIEPQDLELLGVWNWVRELYEEAQATALEGGAAGPALVELTDELALLTRLVLDGGHEMITPQLSVSLVHAVQQPLGRPEWIRLPVVHHPEAPVAVPALDNKFWKVTAWRYLGSHTAVLLGALRLNGASTAAINIEAAWTEWLDDPAQPGPTRTPATAAVDRIQLGSLEDGEIFADGSQTRMVAVYLSEMDTLWFAAPFDQLAGALSPSDVAAPVHSLGDTKHRCVNYRAVASSRFEEYFDEPGLDLHPDQRHHPGRRSELRAAARAGRALRIADVRLGAAGDDEPQGRGPVRQRAQGLPEPALVFLGRGRTARGGALATGRGAAERRATRGGQGVHHPVGARSAMGRGLGRTGADDRLLRRGGAIRARAHDRGVAADRGRCRLQRRV